MLLIESIKMPIPRKQLVHQNANQTKYVLVKLVIMLTNNSDEIRHEQYKLMSSSTKISTIRRWIYRWNPAFINKSINFYYYGNELNDDDEDLTSINYNPEIQIICEIQQ